MPVRSKLFYLYALCAVLYAASFLIPRPISTFQRYELSHLQYRLLSLTILIPTILIWYAAFYGYYKLRGYTKLIMDTPDGKHVYRITTGVMLLAIGLPLSSLVNAATGIISQHVPAFLSAGTIIKNYASLLFPLLGFIFIGLGSRGLSNLSKQRLSFRSVNLLAAIFIASSVAFCYIVMTSHALNEIYHMPVWLVLITIVSPYMYTWYLGMLAVFEIKLYSRKAPGVLYRRTWNMLAVGVASIIVMQIVVQYVGTLTAQFSTEHRLLRLLIIIYVLLASLSVGYLLIALGAKRLKKIEEV